MSERKEMSTEMRSLLAAVLCLVVIVLWSYVYKPIPQVPAPSSDPAATAAPVAATPPPPVASPESTVDSAAPAAVAPPAAASAEQSIIVESDLYRLEISNRGGVVRSWQLKQYSDDNKPPRTLDLVHTEAAQKLGAWPFSLALDNPELETVVNSALYVISPAPQSNVLKAPAEITLHWSNGHVEVTKHLSFDASYMVDVQTTVRLDGKPLAARLAWRGGFGDITASSAALQTRVFTSAAGKFAALALKNLGKTGETGVRATQPTTFDYVGIQDMYFAAAFLPPLSAAGQPAAAPLTLTTWTFTHQTQLPDGKTESETLPEIAVGPAEPGPLAVRLYVGPKSVDELKAVQPPLDGLTQYGWWGFIAEPLFYTLRWLYRYVPNYGWAIVLITIAINMVMFPLKVKSMRSMQKMQTVAPEIKSIQERYKKYGMRDPRKAEMNKEVMAVYQREGINPLGSCWPMLIQMPIWFGLYRMLANSIELRHAPWIGWIRDLSTHDPYYILPVLMTVTMYLMQKMTPSPGVDPAQARMMSMMPLIFGAMFMRSPSGLALYILSSNLIAMGQQWYLYRTTPAPQKAPRGRIMKRT